MAYILRSSTVIRRHWFSGVVTGTPTAQLYVSGVASGSPLVGTGADDAWAFSVPVGALAFGTSVEIWASGLVGAVTERVKLVDGFIADTISELASPSVNVLPAVGIVADRSPGVTLSPVVGETISQSITLYQTDGTTPVDVSAKTLAIVFETLQGLDVAIVASGSITISGLDGNVVTFAYPSAVTASERTLRFAIKDAAAPLTEYIKGLCVVTSGPRVDT